MHPLTRRSNKVDNTCIVIGGTLFMIVPNCNIFIFKNIPNSKLRDFNVKIAQRFRLSHIMGTTKFISSKFQDTDRSKVSLKLHRHSYGMISKSLYSPYREDFRSVYLYNSKYSIVSVCH